MQVGQTHHSLAIDVASEVIKLSTMSWIPCTQVAWREQLHSGMGISPINQWTFQRQRGQFIQTHTDDGFQAPLPSNFSTTAL